MIKKFFEFNEFTQAQFEPIKSFNLKDELNPKIWDNFILDSDIKEDLLKLAYDYFDYVELDGVELEDIILTGSLANFNWSEYSDFDIHLIFDFSKADKNIDLVKKYLDAKEKVWKFQHDIKILGYETELYCQDSKQEHISSGQYSLLNSEWIVKPTKQTFKVDDELIRTKAGKIMKSVKEIEAELDSNKDYVEISSKLKKLWKKIKDGRKAGLEGEGEYSVENLVFKLLRRNGYTQRIIDAKQKSYDRQYK